MGIFTNQLLISFFVFLFFIGSAAAATCGNGVVETGESCDGGSCCTKLCRFQPKTTLCRVANNFCDAAEYCTGSSAACPADMAASKGLICRAPTDLCDEAERCDGVTPSCPADSVRSQGSLCRGRKGWEPCANEMTCDGVSKVCPDQTYNSGGLCREAEGVCDTPEYCAGGSGSCPGNKYLVGVTCAVSKYGYNITCPGGQSYCPKDLKQGPTKAPGVGGPLCGNGVVDLGEECDNATNPCCTNSCSFSPDTTVCRPQRGRCDQPEYCPGTSDKCPGDLILPNGTICRPAGKKSPCDLPEMCNGVAKTCPGDLVAPNNTVCRRAVGSCDLPEVCNGVSKGCPVDVLMPATALCRPGNNATWPCWSSANCDGLNPLCPAVLNVPCP